MKVLVIYRPNSETARDVETFIHDYQRWHNAKRLEIVDADSRDGIATASLYDVVQYPAILALNDSGSILHEWQGAQLPLMSELAYYTDIET